MSDISILNRLGLSKSEGEIYLCLLRKSPLTVGEISKHSGLYRPTIYKILPSLNERNLISQSRKGKRIVYTASSPTSLKNLVEKLESELLQVLPDLNHIYLAQQKRFLIHYFEGKEGVVQIYKDLLGTCKKGDIIYRYESPKDYKKNKKYYPALYLQRAGGKESEIQKFVITNESTHNIRAPQLDRYSKPVPKKFDLFDYDITQIIYRNKVAFIDYESETAIILENEGFAKFQQRIFTLLFDRL